MGTTPKAYVDACRREAWLTMAAAGMRASAVAEALGFSHPSSLARWVRHQGLRSRRGKPQAQSG